MKKLIVLLLALVVVTGAFAQATFNGYSRGTATFVGDGTASLSYRLRFNVSYNDADGNFGAWARIQYDQNKDATNSVLKYGYAWANFFDKKVKVIGGYIANYDYYVGTGISDFQLGNVYTNLCMGDDQKGFIVKLLPVAGLDVGVSFEPPASTAVAASQFAVNAKYSVDNVGTFYVSARPGDSSQGTYASGTFQFTGVKDLSVAASFQYGGTGFYKDYVTDQLSALAIIDYTLGNVSVEVAPVYDISGSTIYVEGYVSYASGPVTVDLLGAYDQTAAQLGSTYWAGAELSYKVGKGYLMGGVWYDGTDVSIPVSLKVVF